MLVFAGPAALVSFAKATIHTTVLEVVVALFFVLKVEVLLELLVDLGPIVSPLHALFLLPPHLGILGLDPLGALLLIVCEPLLVLGPLVAHELDQAGDPLDPGPLFRQHL